MVALTGGIGSMRAVANAFADLGLASLMPILLRVRWTNQVPHLLHAIADHFGANGAADGTLQRRAAASRSSPEESGNALPSADSAETQHQSASR